MNPDLHILLAEDDDVEAEFIQRALTTSDLNLPLYRARDGLEALERLRGNNWQYIVPKPHLLLIDLNMPRMNGLEFLKELRADRYLCTTAVFVITGSEKQTDRIESERLNIHGFFEKNDLQKDPTLLVKAIQAYLEKKKRLAI